MTKLSIAEELDVAIKSAARDAESSETSLQVAQQFYDSQRSTIDPFIADWVIQKLAGLIAKHRLKIRQDANAQLGFELVLGLKMPRRLPPAEKRGKRMLIEDASINKLREYATELRKRKSPALAQVENAIELMQKYTRKKKRITWGEVARLEAERLSKKRPN